MNIVFDTLSHYCSCDGDVIMEGFDGFQIRETPEESFVLYKEIMNSTEVERKFPISDSDVEQFIKLQDRYRDYFEQEKFLFRIMVEVELGLSIPSEEALKKRCDAIYFNQDYLHFVAINMTFAQFYTLCKEKILKNTVVVNEAA